MPLLIDGYNLLHAAGIFGKGRGGASLQRSREAMLRFLATTIDDAERPRTTIVFDASDAPPGLPRLVMHAEMTVHYASNYRDADELIELLIAECNAPRSLLVVSSDHRIQRAAHRRRSRFIDSDEWYGSQVRRRMHSPRPGVDVRKLAGETTEAEVAYWVQRFAAEIAEAADEAPPEAIPEAAPAKQKRRPGKSQPPLARDLANPFPPGYGDDLLDSSDLPPS